MAPAGGYSLTPRKRVSSTVAISNKPPSSSSSSAQKPTPNSLPIPNLFNCHACGTHAKLQPLDSMWRVVLLCPNCLHRIESSDLCSYCFSPVSIAITDALDCRICDRRIHRRCLSPPLPPSHSFTCLDCWLPKSLSHLNSKVLNSGVLNSRLLNATRARHWLPQASPVLQDVVKGVEKAVAVAARARERALRKVAEARRATDLARAVLAARPLSSSATGAPDIDDGELALRLHRAMNSSPRTSKLLGFDNLNSIPSVALKKKKEHRCNGPDLERYDISRKLGNEQFENPLIDLDRNSSVKSDAEAAVAGTNSETNGKIKLLDNVGDDNGAVDSSKIRVESDGIENINSKEGKLEMPMKEEHGSCSNKAMNSSEDDNSVDGLKDLVSSTCSGTLSRSVDDGDSSNLPIKRCIEPDRYLKKYSKRRKVAVA